MKPRLIHHIESIRSVTLRDCCRKILDTPEFLTHPASLSHHHAYEGGLLTHTVEVCDIALGTAGLNISGKIDGAPWEQVLFPKVNRDILIAAALFHDFCKVREYEIIQRPKDPGNLRFLPHGDDPSAVWVKRSSLLGNHAHIIDGTIEFTLAARESSVDESVIEQIQHCILAHHGRREWGSPVEPQTIEALVLHQSDMISAHYGATAHQPTP
jgi:3'-5' exoribonuclease